MKPWEDPLYVDYIAARDAYSRALDMPRFIKDKAAKIEARWNALQKAKERYEASRKARTNPLVQSPYQRPGNYQTNRAWRTNHPGWFVIQSTDRYVLVDGEFTGGVLIVHNAAETFAKTKAGLASKARQFLKGFKITSEIE